MQVASIALELSEASQAKLSGAASDAKLIADGASQLDLASLTLRSADIRLSSASSAALEVSETLSYHLSAASSLVYSGNPSKTDGTKSGHSSISHKR